MAVRISGKDKNKNYSVIEELKRIKNINGKKRTIEIGILDNRRPHGNDTISASEYGEYVNNNPRYHFSDGTGTSGEKIDRSKKIKKSIKKIGKTRRTTKELDDITIHMAKIVVDDIRLFISKGANNIYQRWKGTSSMNLIETGNLIKSIVGVVKDNKGREIWRGR